MSAGRSAQAGKIDEIMSRASDALVSTDYGEADRLCRDAWQKAREANDFDRCARICLPLQEARRQRREAALDAPGEFLLNSLPGRDEVTSPGRYLLEPPLVGVDARRLREVASEHRVAVMVLVREPLTRAGKMPIVGVGTGPREPVVVRIRVDPPGAPLAPTWFSAMHEALGDAAIALAPRGVPADHHVDDLMDLLEAVPEHEKLIQALQAACRLAARSPASKAPRRRPLVDNPYSF